MAFKLLIPNIRLEFEHTLGGGEGQGIVACCRTWGRKELNMT